jgi:hypothetical protein
VPIGRRCISPSAWGFRAAFPRHPASGSAPSARAVADTSGCVTPRGCRLTPSQPPGTRCPRNSAHLPLALRRLAVRERTQEPGCPRATPGHTADRSGIPARASPGDTACSEVPEAFARLSVHHRTFPPSQAHRKQGPFPPRALPGFLGRTARSDFHPGRRSDSGVGVAVSPASGSPPITQTTFWTCRAPYPDGSEQVLAGFFPARAAFPLSQRGRHPPLHFRGLLELHSRYGLPSCPPTSDLRPWGALRNPGFSRGDFIKTIARSNAGSTPSKVSGNSTRPGGRFRAMRR